MLRANLVANFLGQGWVALMGIVFVPLYIRYLGIEAYGVIGLFAVLQAWLSLLDIGLTPMLGREMARFTGGSHTNERIRDLLRSVETVAACIAILIAGGLWVGSDWLAREWLRAETLPATAASQAFAIMGIVTALRVVEGVHRSSLVGLQRQVLVNGISASLATLRGLGAVGVLLWIAPTIQAFFIWQGVISLMTVCMFAAGTYRSLPAAMRPGRFSISALRGVWRFAGGMLATTFLALLLTQVDKVLLSTLLSLSEYGYYMLAAAVAGALYMLISPVTQAWYPRLCQLHSLNQSKQMASAYHQGAQLVTVTAGSAGIVVALFSETLLHLWTQDRMLATHAAPVLSVMILGNLLNGLMWMPYQAQLAHGWTSLAVRTNIVAVILIVPAILWITPRYGAQGAAWVWVCLNAGYLLVGVHLMFRRILASEKWQWYARDVIGPLSLSALGALSVKLYFGSPQTSSGQLISLATAGVAALGGAMIAAPHAREVVKGLIRPSLQHLRVKSP